MAASATKLPLERLNLIIADSPHVAFYAFKFAVQNDHSYIAIAANAIATWAMTEEHRRNTFWYRRYRGLSILAEIDSQAVLEITSCFPQDDMFERPYLAARFRNGDFVAGIKWLARSHFDSDSAVIQELVDHVCRKYGDTLVQAVGAALEKPHLTVPLRGVLLLAGHIADSTLAAAVRKAWALAEEPRDLRAFLWAAARVCGDEAETTLGPVCDAWEALPDIEDEGGRSARNSLAAYGVDWRFRAHVPKAALPYFSERAKQSESLAWPITYMLRGVDDPAAVEHEVEYLAQRRRVAGSHGFFDHFLRNEWERLTGAEGKRMSVASKQRLLDISADQNNDEHLRKQAFSLWEISFGVNDIDIARNIKQGDPRYDKALWARARRRDMTVVSALIEKIAEDPRYWWQAGRYLWTDELTEALGNTIKEVAAASAEDHDRKGGWIIPELILKLSPETGESLLLPVWDEVRHIPGFLQSALCIATPKLVNLVKVAVASAADPHILFEHFSSTVGINTKGRLGITSIKQLTNLKPYFAFLSDIDLHDVWEICNKQGWHDFATDYLEPILEKRSSDFIKRVYGGRVIDLTDLDTDLNDHQKKMSYGWIERNIRRGAQRSDVVNALFDWLRQKKSLSALKIVAHVFVQEGSRLEFEKLMAAAADIHDAEEILDSIQFAIFSRRLA